MFMIVGRCAREDGVGGISEEFSFSSARVVEIFMSESAEARGG
jgi:hypothetical protein